MVEIITVPVLALIALTGVTFGFHDTARSVWYAMTFTQAPPHYPEEPLKMEPAGRELFTLDELAARVAARTDVAATSFYGLSAEKKAAVSVSLTTGWDPNAGFNGYDGNVYTFSDPYTGGVVWKQDPRELPLAARIYETWVFPLHTGSFGRVPVRVLWALVGLAPTVLAITGLTMWLLKGRAARRRRKPTRAAVRT